MTDSAVNVADLFCGKVDEVGMSTASKETMKDLIRQIVRAKYQADKESILFINPDLYDELQKQGLVIHWKENHPGAIWWHNEICGMTAVIDLKEKYFSILAPNEARKRIIERTNDL